MSQYDDQLPEDLRDIAARLSAARVTPTPLELDELRRRVHGRVGRAGRSPQRRGFAGALRTKLVAVCLTLGLTMTTGVGVVLACDSFGGGGQNQFGNVWQTTSFRHDHDASYCQYHGPETWSYSWRTRHSILTVFYVWDCKHLTVFFQCGEPFGFRWDNGGWNDTDLTSYNSVAPNEDSALTVTVDGVTYTLSPNGAPPSQAPNPSYTVTFNANGGTGATASETENAPTALTADGFTRTGYTFAGWNTSPTGGGTAYGAGASYPFTANATLYAQWKANPSFTVTFNANRGSGFTPAETHNVPTALSADGFTRSGYTFAGWNTSPSGGGTAYGAGATYAFTANATLYAQWTAVPPPRRH
jgi:uncharacterized repeat protein (TIGR02543 family)